MNLTKSLIRFDLLALQNTVQSGNPNAIQHVNGAISFPDLIITQNHINDCAKIYDIISTTWLPSKERDCYLALIDLICNRDFDIKQIADATFSVVRNFIIFAFSLCIDRIDVILNAYPTLLDDTEYEFIISEVIYNPAAITKLVEYDLDYFDVIVRSFWIAGKQNLLLEYGIKQKHRLLKMSELVNKGTKLRIKYIEEALMLKQIFPSEQVNREYDPVNYYQYLELEAAGFDVKLTTDKYFDKRYFTQAEDFYLLLK